jgi:hypothetical protein
MATSASRAPAAFMSSQSPIGTPPAVNSGMSLSSPYKRIWNDGFFTSGHGSSELSA